MAHVAGYLHAAAAAAGAPDSQEPLLLCEGRATSAQEASSRVAALAAGLTGMLGMQLGDRVCLAALATDSHLEALLAVTSAGGVAAPLNWRWGAVEAAAAVQLVGARLLACDAACLPFALSAAAAGGPVQSLLLLGPPGGYCEAALAGAPPGLRLAFAEALVAGCPDASLALSSAPGNIALIVFTSGTTGKPKGVALSHSSLHSQSMAKLLTCGYSASDVYLHAAPLFHIGGLSSALAMLAARARHVFLPRFDGAALLDAIRGHAVTAFIAVPAMVADLLAAASEAGVAALPSVTRVLVGGGGLSPGLAAGLAALCPAAAVHGAYGMTEAASSLTFATLWRPSAPPASTNGGSGTAAGVAAEGGGAAGPAGGVFVGAPPPGVELAVYRPPGGGPGVARDGGGAGGVRLAGEGEVVTRGPHLMLGYWDDEEATAAVQLPGGWLRTGDLGCLRQGHLWLMGRAKDMIKSGGENVHAWEVERAVAAHPGVATAAVVAVSDWRLGEAVAAAVVLRPGWRWAGPRCQVLLTSAARQQPPAKAVLAAAAAAVAPVARGGNADGGEGGEDGWQAAGGGSDGATWEEDLRGTLLQLPSSRPGSGQGIHGSGAGLLAALQLPLRGMAGGQPSGEEREQRLCSMLQLLAGVAAGLESATAAGGTAAAPGRRGGGEGPPAEDKVLDGSTLQQHCRAARLAGFKLPRVFLLCDAAAPSAALAGSGGAAGGGAVLPVNATGKVVKHLLRQQIQQHMQATAKAGAAPGDGRPRARM